MDLSGHDDADDVDLERFHAQLEQLLTDAVLKKAGTDSREDVARSNASGEDLPAELFVSGSMCFPARASIVSPSPPVKRAAAAALFRGEATAANRGPAGEIYGAPRVIGGDSSPRFPFDAAVLDARGPALRRAQVAT